MTNFLNNFYTFINSPSWLVEIYLRNSETFNNLFFSVYNFVSFIIMEPSLLVFFFSKIFNSFSIFFNSSTEHMRLIFNTFFWLLNGNVLVIDVKLVKLKIIMISIIFFIIFCSILLLISFLVSPKLKNFEKVTPYECGFNQFEDTRSVFEIHFYKIAILFIIFDLEIAFLLPWVLYYKMLGFFGFWLIMLFLFILTLGFVYEFMTGSLEWE
jgi:NADH-quinone oxidoreductase subunit A